MTSVERTVARAIESQARMTGRLTRRQCIRLMLRKATIRGFVTGAALTALAAVLGTAYALGVRCW